MDEKKQQSKLDKIYEEAKERTHAHLKNLHTAKDNQIIESDRIFQYLQQTIDCLQLCIDHLPQESQSRQKYARYKDELGELGDEVVRLTNPNRW